MNALLTTAPRLVLLMGANGAGKSTWTAAHRAELPDRFFNREATTGRLGLCPDVDRARRSCLAERASFGIETTFTRRWRHALVRMALAAGYRIDAIFIGTASSRINVERVRARHRAGRGHLVPPRTVHRRWESVQDNLVAVAGRLATVRLLDSTFTPTRAIAVYDAAGPLLQVADPPRWCTALLAGLSGARRRAAAPPRPLGP